MEEAFGDQQPAYLLGDRLGQSLPPQKRPTFLVAAGSPPWPCVDELIVVD